MGIHDDRRAGVGLGEAVGVRRGDAELDGVLGRLLDAGIESQHEVVARFRQAATGHDALRPAERVDLDLRGAVLALQPLVVGRLHAALADLVVGQVALELGLFELLGVDLAEIAEDWRGQVSQRVGAQVALLDLHARERLEVLEQVGDQRPRDVAFDDHEVVRQPGLLGDEGQHGLGPHVHERGEAPGQRGELALRHVHRSDADGKPGPVVDEDTARAVFDHATRRLDLERAQAVVLGLGHVGLGVEDLQHPETKDKDAENRQRDGGQDGHSGRHRRQAQRHPPAVSGLLAYIMPAIDSTMASGYVLQVQVVLSVTKLR